MRINNQGIGLVEAVLAIAFAVVLVVALLSLTTFNVQNATNVSERQEASKNSSTTLERLRFIKDNSFEVFFSTFHTNCYQDYCYFSTNSSNTPSSCAPSSETNLSKRGVTCFKVSTDPNSLLEDAKTELIIEVVSTYQINKVLFSTSTETIFTNWRTRQ